MTGTWEENYRTVTKVVLKQKIKNEDTNISLDRTVTKVVLKLDTRPL